ncbi:MAG: hypothetical protein JST73_02745 [Actinobacteria bacterium]|nr:hypothetical protein [Actinomycetota bacterium]
MPHEGAEPTWVPGPAPATGGDAVGPVDFEPGSGGGDTGGGVGVSTGADEGPSGLEPVSWYTEPGQGSPGADASSVDAGRGSPVDSGSFEMAGAPDPGSPPPPPPPQAEGDQEIADRFDPNALFAEPEPEPAPTFGSDLQPATDFAVNWEPAAADVWDTPVEPKGHAKRESVLSREARMLIAGIVIVLVAVAAIITFRSRGDNYPAEWASNVEQVAQWVSKSRGLNYAHPVAVTTLDASAYDAAVTAAEAPRSDSDKSRVADQVAMWRALGAVQGTPSLASAVIVAQRPQLGAFYDLAGKRLVLRNGTDLSTLRVGVAGALSIALDDQRTNLSSLRSEGIGEDALFDVVMGTASLVRSDYARSQTKEHGAASDAVAVGVRPDAKNDFFAERAAMRTGLGAGFVQLVRDVQTRHAANQLALAPQMSAQQVMFPLKYLVGQGSLAVDQPPVPSGANVLDKGSLGAQSWYLLISGHLADPSEVAGALNFAELWAGDAFVAYRRPDGHVCVADAIRGATDSDGAQLAGTLQSWRGTMAGAKVTVDASGAVVTVTGCDPGPSVQRGLRDTSALAVSVATTRSDLAAGYYLAGTKIPNGVNGAVFTPDQSWCMADNAVRSASPAQIPRLARRAEPTYRDLTIAAGAACNTNNAPQLFANQPG